MPPIISRVANAIAAKQICEFVSAKLLKRDSGNDVDSRCVLTLWHHHTWRIGNIRFRPKSTRRIRTEINLPSACCEGNFWIRLRTRFRTERRPMRIELHTDLATLAPLAANWNKLARGVPFRQWEWNEAWWRHYGLNSDGKSLNTWRADLTPTWEDFLMVLSKNHRNRLRRADRTYIQSGLVQSHPASSPMEFVQAFDVLVDLHQRRWNSRGLPGCFSLPRFKAFHREISELFINTGRAMLTWMEFEGKPLSAEYRLLGGRVMYAYQSGVDPDRLEIQPGELANMGAMRAAIEQKYASYDFLRGDEEYKSRWRGKPRATLAVRVVPPRATSRLRHSAWLTGQSVKNVIKGGLQLTGLRSASN